MSCSDVWVGGWVGGRRLTAPASLANQVPYIHVQPVNDNCLFLKR